MERNKYPKKRISTNEDLYQLAGTLIGRSTLSAQLGTQAYGGDRDVQRALGYLDRITYKDYLARYIRQDIAKAIIDRPVKKTWSGPLLILEHKDDNETALETAWVELEKRLQLKSKFQRVDKLAGLGKYGVLLLGFGDVKSVEDFANPVTSNDLKYVQPYGESSAEISKYETDPKNPRYGLPLFYNIISQQALNTTVVRVHHSRIIHIVDDVLESEIEGLPRLEVVFNRLMDLEKLIGGDAEMFWRGARPGYQAKLDKDFQKTTSFETDLQNQINEYEHNLRRMLVNEGVSYESLQQQIADPATHVDIQLQMISAVTGIPKRILVGSERGELSSGQDADEWRTYIQDRREEYAEPRIVRAFVDKMIELKVLPKPTTEDYQVKWSDLFALSDKDRVDIGSKRATAISSYVGNPMAESVIPPKAFMEFCLGLTDDQIDLINEMSEAEIMEEPEEVEEPAIEPEDKDGILTQGGAGSGNFGHAGRPGFVGGSTDIPVSEKVKNSIKDLQIAYDNNTLEYNYYGIRFESETRPELKEGDSPGNSKSNRDREDSRDFPIFGTPEYEEMEELDGTSAYFVFNAYNGTVNKFINQVLSYINNEGKESWYLLGSNRLSELEGEDDNEIIMQDAVVIKKY